MNPAITSATQWFERTLDDSANKRLSIPEGFLAIDGICLLYTSLTYATLFSGVRQDSGDPYEWGDKMIAHYNTIGRAHV